jgi:hypothetical protein
MATFISTHFLVVSNLPNVRLLAYPVILEYGTRLKYETVNGSLEHQSYVVVMSHGPYSQHFIFFVTYESVQ